VTTTPLAVAKVGYAVKLLLEIGVPVESVDPWRVNLSRGRR